LAENPEVMVEVSEKVKAAAGLGQDAGGFTAADDEPIELD
jgi:hypothetical protein